MLDQRLPARRWVWCRVRLHHQSPQATVRGRPRARRSVWEPTPRRLRVVESRPVREPAPRQVPHALRRTGSRARLRALRDQKPPRAGELGPLWQQRRARTTLRVYQLVPACSCRRPDPTSRISRYQLLSGATRIWIRFRQPNHETRPQESLPRKARHPQKRRHPQ